MITPAAGSGASAIGPVSFSVPVGNALVSMIRPLNCASRWLSSLWIVAIWTVNCAAVTEPPVIVMFPLICDVRPTATFCWPASTSFTR